MIGCDPNVKRKVILESELNGVKGDDGKIIIAPTPEADQTVFYVVDLTKSARLEAVSRSTTEGAEGLNGYAAHLLRHGLRGWDNLKNADGVSIEFKANDKGEPTEESIERIPFGPRMELANLILTRSDLKERDRKNSQSPPDSSPEN